MARHPFDVDYLIVGSGFGGSVSALRLAQKGYKVLVVEKGRRLGPDDFPKSNWNLKRWMWVPLLGFRGLFKMTFLPHITALTGVGVGGGSLVYANTLPIPRDEFFEADSWGNLADWKSELAEHYQEARRMLGAVANPNETEADKVIARIAADIGRSEHHEKTTVAVYFGEPGVTVPDPYHGGDGPDRTGCIGCGGCMIGCRHNAKNTLDKNYLYLAEKLGTVVEPDTEVTWVRPIDGGYEVEAKTGTSIFWRRPRRFRARNVIFAGGVLGTVDLLLRLARRSDGLPRLSERLGDYVRTNSEVLMGVVSRRRDVDYSKGVAITSILHTDDHSHLEPVRYPAGSGFFRTLMMPHAAGQTLLARMANMMRFVARHPIQTMRTYFVPDMSKYTIILLYMRTLEGHLRLRLTRKLRSLYLRSSVTTEIGEGPSPSASIPEATELGHRIAEHIDGMPISMATETLFGIPSTAHILGGCVMGDSLDSGVIDHRHRVHGYEGLYVIDGSAVSANPGVNPSLTICALAERAMTFIPGRSELSDTDRPSRAPG